MKNPVPESIIPVLENPKHVNIDLDVLDTLVPELAKEDFPVPSMVSPAFIQENTSRTMDFFFITSSINFKFWYEDTKERFKSDLHGERYTGSMAMSACLLKAMESGMDVLDPGFLSNLTLDQAGDIFKGDRPIPMLEERKEILNKVGRVLLEKYNGKVSELIRRSGGRCFSKKGNTGIVERVVRDFPSFNDQAVYRPTGDTISFYKRAQMFPSILYARLYSRGLFDAEDMDSLTVFADYQLPKALLSMGVMRYSPALWDKIKRRVLLSKGSEEELEIRAHTIHSAQLLMSRINGLRPREEHINALHFDHYLWRKGRSYTEPFHLVRTTFY